MLRALTRFVLPRGGVGRSQTAIAHVWPGCGRDVSLSLFRLAFFHVTDPGVKERDGEGRVEESARVTE